MNHKKNESFHKKFADNLLENDKTLVESALLERSARQSASSAAPNVTCHNNFMGNHDLTQVSLLSELFLIAVSVAVADDEMPSRLAVLTMKAFNTSL